MQKKKHQIIRYTGLFLLAKKKKSLIKIEMEKNVNETHLCTIVEFSN